MGATTRSATLNRAVPSAVVPSALNSVDVLTEPQLGPYSPMTGKSRVPFVPNTVDPADAPPSPGFGGLGTQGSQRNSGGAGAPSVPGMNGVLFTPGTIDQHYMSEAEGYNPVAKVNNPPTRGMLTWVKDYINGIATSQDTDTAGWKARHPQQRTSHMRITPPAHGIGYAPEIFEPRQMPQGDNTYKYPPAIGTDVPGSGVLNSSTFGAGQTAGGVGGSQYTPSPGPPPTFSTAAGDSPAAGMPTWG